MSICSTGRAISAVKNSAIASFEVSNRMVVVFAMENPFPLAMVPSDYAHRADAGLHPAGRNRRGKFGVGLVRGSR